MPDWNPFSWDSGNWKNAAKGGAAGFAVGGPVGAIIGAYGGGTFLPDGQAPYNTAQQGATDASNRLQQLSQLQWDRQMQGLQLAQQPLNNYRTLYDRIYGTNTAQSQFSNPTPPAPPPGPTHQQTPEQHQQVVNSMSAHGPGPGMPPPSMTPPMIGPRPGVPTMGATNPYQQLATNNGFAPPGLRPRAPGQGFMG